MKKTLHLFLICLLTSRIVAQVIPSYIPTTSLVAWWPFTGNANDGSGNGNNGTVNGATLIADRYGNTNSAYLFNGSSDLITGTGLNFPMGNSPRTISLWVTTSSTGLSKCAFEYGVTSACNDVVLVGMTNVGKAWSANSCGSFNSTLTINNGAWHHLAMVYNGAGTNTLYVDGVSAAMGTYTYNTQTSTFNIGRLTTQTQFSEWMYWDGKVDDIAIWSRALSACEVKKLYTSELFSISASSSTICAGSSAVLTASGASGYSWNTGATTASISVSPTLTTMYTVTASIGGGCTDTRTFSINVNPCTGIEEQAATNKIVIYPNPVSGICNLELPETYLGKEFYLIDRVGKIMLTGTINSSKTSINTLNLPNGVYVFRTEDGNCKRIVVLN
ncbi:MAG: T9SS type A sorting domain-containing protein [Bacteroidetes bacterium]|nr:T9SS type A sorting domain-containing protein [Bacteroidota bacterium]